jgi:hypothetical protein
MFVNSEDWSAISKVVPEVTAMKNRTVGYFLKFKGLFRNITRLKRYGSI